MVGMYFVQSVAAERPTIAADADDADAGDADDSAALFGGFAVVWFGLEAAVSKFLEADRPAGIGDTENDHTAAHMHTKKQGTIMHTKNSVVFFFFFMGLTRATRTHARVTQMIDPCADADADTDALAGMNVRLSPSSRLECAVFVADWRTSSRRAGERADRRERERQRVRDSSQTCCQITRMCERA